VERRRGKTLLVALLRALALTLLIALLLDAVAGLPRPVAPIVALDVSKSWLRGADSAGWNDARARARAVARDSLFLVGDSVRVGALPDRPTDDASRLRPLVERALSTGRPLRLFTDGEVDDPDALAAVPAGSQVVVINPGASPDAAVADIQAPRAVIGNDTAEFRIAIATGRAGAGEGTLSLVIGDQRVASTPVQSLAAFGERTVTTRARVPNVPGATLVRAIVAAAGDREPRNDTLTTVLEVSPAAGAVLVSTSPDLDSREALALLRGALALPTRGFYRVAPGVWRQDGSLGPANEREIRAIVRDAPLVVLHGDTRCSARRVLRPRARWRSSRRRRRGAQTGMRQGRRRLPSQRHCPAPRGTVSPRSMLRTTFRRATGSRSRRGAGVASSGGMRSSDGRVRAGR
jgi:hypothetical protein